MSNRQITAYVIGLASINLVGTRAYYMWMRLRWGSKTLTVWMSENRVAVYSLKQYVGSLLSFRQRAYKTVR